MAKTYVNALGTLTPKRSVRAITPQSKPVPGVAQVKNEAGGYVFAVTPWVQLDRFLVIGTEGGTFYVAERKLTKEQALSVVTCIEADGLRTVARIVEISTGGRAVKQSPALLALALAASKGNDATKLAALRALPQVARTATALFEFLAYVQEHRGWGRGLRSAVAAWYTSKTADQLAYQLVKYASRDGWSHRDVLRLAHVQPQTPAQGIALRYAAKGAAGFGQFEVDLRTADGQEAAKTFEYLQAVEGLKATKTLREAVHFITQYKLPREVVPTEWLTSPDVWSALLRDMPLTAMVRNLATMTRVGLLAPMSVDAQIVQERLADTEYLRKSRVHPFSLLTAKMTYQSGHGFRGGNSWVPVQSVTDALEQAFYDSFKFIVPSGKRHLLGVDWSGSMGSGEVAGIPGMTPAIGAACMALVTARTEPNYHAVAFATSIKAVDLSRFSRLDQVIRATALGTGEGTDCALPMRYALQHQIPVDAFVVYTDSQSWYGGVHPFQALQQYRRAMGIDAKLVTVGMVSNGVSIGDQTDAGSLDVVGFDAATPALISGFVQGW